MSQLTVAQGRTEVIDVRPQKLSRIRVLEGDLVLVDNTQTPVGGQWEAHGSTVDAVVVTALGADAVLEYGSAA